MKSVAEILQGLIRRLLCLVGLPGAIGASPAASVWIAPVLPVVLLTEMQNAYIDTVCSKVLVLPLNVRNTTMPARCANIEGQYLLFRSISEASELTKSNRVVPTTFAPLDISVNVTETKNGLATNNNFNVISQKTFQK